MATMPPVPMNQTDFYVWEKILKTFVCKIEIEHDALELGPFQELSAMVHGVANLIELGEIDGKIHGYNGNSVGNFYVESDS